VAGVLPGSRKKRLSRNVKKFSSVKMAVGLYGVVTPAEPHPEGPPAA
jgi:hypothetical protein